MAAVRRQPMAVIHHSDHGSQYTPLSFGKRCETFGIRVSMGTFGDCYDNAMAESFFASTVHPTYPIRLSASRPSVLMNCGHWVLMVTGLAPATVNNHLASLSAFT
jgi:transposase InsO family protein